jgi:hypothetical protein
MVKHGSTFALLVLLLLSIVFAPVVKARAGRGRFLESGERVDNIHKLHKALHIGDDPTEDIRTNIMLNMEGI